MPAKWLCGAVLSQKLGVENAGKIWYHHLHKSIQSHYLHVKHR